MKRIAVLDFETDPFLFGRPPEPFAAGFYDGSIYADFWGDDCVQKLAAFLAEQPPATIYAHNGGKFDFFFLLRAGLLDNPLRIINGRIVSAKMGRHELRDSYAILPFALGKYKKSSIDYKWFERDAREEHRADILEYQALDCEYLRELVEKFVAEFGRNLTIGATAMRELRKIHKIEKRDGAHDERFRKYYYGGRVECIESGIIRDDFRIYDVNSMYPSVMRDCQHPGNGPWETVSGDTGRLDEFGELKDFPAGFPYLASIECVNRGALPMRVSDRLSFREKRGIYHVTGHEIRTAIALGLIDHINVIDLHIPTKSQTFGEFVDKYYGLRLIAEDTGDKAAKLFYKLILNSSYGKFGQNPDNFKDWYVRTDMTEDPRKHGWKPYADYGDMDLWWRPSDKATYYDVSIAASITGAARAVLMRGLAAADRPVYCDTDSIICRDMPASYLDESRLGAWKIEAIADEIAIAGKKMYAAFRRGECVKHASKGVAITPEQIRLLCLGEIIETKRDAPNFKLSGETKFVERSVRQLT